MWSTTVVKWAFTLYFFSVKYFAHRELCLPHGTAAKGKRFNSMMLKYIIMFWHNCISNGLSEKGMHKCQLQHGTNKALLCAREQSALWQYSHIMLCYFYFLYLNPCQQLFFLIFPNGRLQTWCDFTAIKIIISVSIMHIKL